LPWRNRIVARVDGSPGEAKVVESSTGSRELPRWRRFATTEALDSSAASNSS
jgi:hypothetical protein